MQRVGERGCDLRASGGDDDEGGGRGDEGPTQKQGRAEAPTRPGIARHVGQAHRQRRPPPEACRHRQDKVRCLMGREERNGEERGTALPVAIRAGTPHTRLMLLS